MALGRRLLLTARSATTRRSAVRQTFRESDLRAEALVSHNRMSEKETITVADVSTGPGGAESTEADAPVEVPAVELLTGRGFITGKSGSGKSNTASVVVEKLLSKNFPVLIVDTDGEYYGLKQEFELLHAGADDECDIHVTPDHAEKLASLALEQNVPIILDVSSYLDESDANEMVLEVTKHLFAKEKKLKKPFLMLVEECHEYIPEGGGMDETGKMLIKVGKRGRKHGLGIVGISQRPADVKKDYITQCDWLVWHRLTWNNDTKVVGRILGSDYASAIEDMGDGEAFLMTDWAEEIRRVQFRRKQTFDAGATPGLDDFERPDLKSVSGDLVSELTNISDEKERRESELADLRQELDKKRQQIIQLENELEEARDMSRMADTFAQALLQRAEAPHRRNGAAPAEAPATPTPSPVPDASDDVRARIDAKATEENADAPDDAEARPLPEDQSELYDYEAAVDGGDVAPDGDEGDGDETGGSDDGDDVEDAGPTDESVTTAAAEGDETEGAEGERPRPVRVVAGGTEATAGESAERDADAFGVTPEATPGAAPAGSADVAETGRAAIDRAVTDVDRLTDFFEGLELRESEAVVRGFARAIGQFDEVTRGMLAYYCDVGVSSPVDAHVAAGGSGDRHWAYARNRALRRAGLVEHHSRGVYQYCLPTLVAEVFADGVDGQTLANTVAAVETASGLREAE